LYIRSCCNDLTFPYTAQAESVSVNLKVPVLQHSSLKPSYACINLIRQYFANLPSPVHTDELIVVGDRLLTDVIMANRMGNQSRIHLGPPAGTISKTADDIDKEKGPVKQRPSGPLAVWTTQVWEREATIVRWSEQRMLQLIRRWIIQSVPTSGPETLKK
jgi:phosphatidylglycerophosphatase GEP4